ncbi:MAG TPA: hypothetical protein VHS99_01680, partial [Chloroflexota bacterium]|nr:hypothetical protein [Chloroflexota bacterium]
GAVADSVIRFERTVELAGTPGEARLQLAADGPARLLVNGQEIGRQGGFDPYGHRRRVRIRAYDLAPVLRPGSNLIAVEVLDVGEPCGAMVDALVADSTGRRVSLITDHTWQASRDGRAVPLTQRRRQDGDPAWAHLWRRPHPLPQATWLEHSPPQGVVVPLQPDPSPGQPRVEWLRFLLPPGAEIMTVPVTGSAAEVTAYVDGVAVAVEPGPGETYRVALPAPQQPSRSCALRVARTGGGLGGALLRGPLTFAGAGGQLAPGDWETRGLSAYSGGVAYRRRLDLPPSHLQPVPPTWLDLGRVRGTAEVLLNGRAVGTRVWSPYRFELTEFLRPGTNTIEVRIFNTLAPYLAAVSPTHYVFPGQTVSGLLGPVHLLTAPPP